MIDGRERMNRKKQWKGTRRGQHYEKEVVCETTAWAKPQLVHKSWMKRAEKISFDLRAGITGLRPSKGDLVTWIKTQLRRSTMDAAEARLVLAFFWNASMRYEEVMGSRSDDQAIHAFKKMCVGWRSTLVAREIKSDEIKSKKTCFWREVETVMGILGPAVND